MSRSAPSSAAVSNAPGPLASFPCVAKARFARQLRFACFFFGQNTEHVHADAATSWRVDKPDLLVPLLQGLGKLKRLLSRVSLDDVQNVRAVPHAEADRVDHLRSPWREPWSKKDIINGRPARPVTRL